MYTNKNYSKNILIKIKTKKKDRVFFLFFVKMLSNLLNFSTLFLEGHFLFIILCINLVNFY